MKSKKLRKKLTLNKSTVVDLNKNEEKNIRGGCSPTHPNSGCTNFPNPCEVKTFFVVCDTELECP